MKVEITRWMDVHATNIDRLNWKELIHAIDSIVNIASVVYTDNHKVTKFYVLSERLYLEYELDPEMGNPELGKPCQFVKYKLNNALENLPSGVIATSAYYRNRNY